MGLYTAVIAGILGSLLGGSKFSITGPTGAMTVIILASVSKHGLEGLLVAGFLAGVIQVFFGIIKLGQFIKFIPFPIVSGFTAGIGAIIFIGQISNALGLTISSKEHVWQTLIEIVRNLSQANFLAIIFTIFTVLCLILLPKLFSKVKFLKNVPPSVIPLILSTAAVIVLGLDIPQVGEIPSGLPSFQLISINFELVKNVLPAALTIALLGIIEALLCAVVCDGMTNTKHGSNKELIGQGICNLVLPFFGGIPSTAAIARSAVNIREGAKTRVAGIIHGIFLLLILLFFAPIAQYIPRSFLAGILMVVSVKMINIHEFKTIIKISHLESTVLFITFLLTIFTDLVFAVEVGMILAIFLVFIRLTNIINITSMKDYQPHEKINALVYTHPSLKEKVSIYTIHGPFFFGAMNLFDKKTNEHISIRKPITLLRMKYVTFIDSTGLVRLIDFIQERQKKGIVVLLVGPNLGVKKILNYNKEFASLVKKEFIFENTPEALDYVEKNLSSLTKK